MRVKEYVVYVKNIFYKLPANVNEKRLINLRKRHVGTVFSYKK